MRLGAGVGKTVAEIEIDLMPDGLAISGGDETHNHRVDGPDP